MKIQIRQGVFETNSSSTHAICIKENPKIDLPEKIHFSIDEEFGWENDIYSSLDDKASYLYLAILETTPDCSYKCIGEIVQKLTVIQKWLQEDKIDCEFDNIQIHIAKWGAYIECGHIDHGFELSEFVNWILKSKNHLYAYLFDSDSCICTGNDNDEEELAIPSGDFKIFEKGN